VHLQTVALQEAKQAVTLDEIKKLHPIRVEPEPNKKKPVEKRELIVYMKFGDDWYPIGLAMHGVEDWQWNKML
jgi:hypothetical protein